MFFCCCCCFSFFFVFFCSFKCVIYNRLSVYVTGRRIAELELHIALAHMMKNFKVEYPENTPMDYIENFFQVVPERKINLVFKDVSK